MDASTLYYTDHVTLLARLPNKKALTLEALCQSGFYKTHSSSLYDISRENPELRKISLTETHIGCWQHAVISDLCYMGRAAA